MKRTLAHDLGRGAGGVCGLAARRVAGDKAQGLILHLPKVSFSLRTSFL